VKVFWSTDKMQTWQEKVALTFDDVGTTLWNTSVDQAYINGIMTFVMAVEIPAWNTIFATAPSPEGPWTILDQKTYFMPKANEHANPTIRWFADLDNRKQGWFYLNTATDDAGVPCADNAKRFWSELYRTRDLKTWEQSPSFDIGPNTAHDKPIAPASMVSPQNLAWMSNHSATIETWLDCNNSDMDLCEFNGSTVMTYLWGHQGSNGGLGRIDSPVGLREFLEGWAPWVPAPATVPRTTRGNWRGPRNSGHWI
jgi:hypothetical protein